MKGTRAFYNLLLSQQTTVPPSLDSDAAAFLTAAGITDPVIKNAINDRVLAYKASGLWSKLLWDYPMCGGTALAHSLNLKNPAAHQLTWIGSPVHSSTGVSFNATNYGTNNVVPNISFPFYGKASGIWFKGIAPDNSWIWGCYDGSYLWGARVLTSGLVTGVGDNNVHEAAGGFSSAFRRFTIDVNNSTTTKIYSDNVESILPGVPTISSQCVNPIYIGGISGLPGYLFVCTIDGFWHANATLSNTEHSTIDAIILAFQTALSRA